jgi:hypothetical protein
MGEREERNQKGFCFLTVLVIFFNHYYYNSHMMSLFGTQHVLQLATAQFRHRDLKEMTASMGTSVNEKEAVPP